MHSPPSFPRILVERASSMSGRLVISQKKSYHPWSSQNLTKVSRDEADAAAASLEKASAIDGSRLADVRDSNVLRLLGKGGGGREERRGEEGKHQTEAFTLFPEAGGRGKGKGSSKQQRSSKVVEGQSETLGKTLDDGRKGDRGGVAFDGDSKRNVKRRREDDPMAEFIKDDDVANEFKEKEEATADTGGSTALAREKRDKKDKQEKKKKKKKKRKKEKKSKKNKSSSSSCSSSSCSSSSSSSSSSSRSSLFARLRTSRLERESLEASRARELVLAESSAAKLPAMSAADRIRLYQEQLKLREKLRSEHEAPPTNKTSTVCTISINKL